MNFTPLLGKLVTVTIPMFTPRGNPYITTPYTITGVLVESECSTEQDACIKLIPPDDKTVPKELKAAFVTQPTHIRCEIIQVVLEIVNLPQLKKTESSPLAQSK